MYRLFILCTLTLSLFSLSCRSDSSSEGNAVESEKSNVSKEDLLESLKPIQENLIEAFWIAQDETLRENTAMTGHHQKKDEFVAEHKVALHSIAPIENSAKQKAILRITIPEVANAYYEFVFDGNTEGWESVDGRTKVLIKGDPFEQNYFKGKFLGEKSLKPYLDKALSLLVK